MIRPARFADIPGIVDVVQDGHRRSHYAFGKCEVDVKEAKRILVQSMQRHGSHNLGGTWVVVSETEGRITGVLLGTLARVALFTDRLFASDLFWLVTEDVDPRDAVRLMRSMIQWAKANPDCIEVKCGVQNVISDSAGAGRILERLGLTEYGQIFRADTASL